MFHVALDGLAESQKSVLVSNKFPEAFNKHLGINVVYHSGYKDVDDIYASTLDCFYRQYPAMVGPARAFTQMSYFSQMHRVSQERAHRHNPTTSVLVTEFSFLSTIVTFLRTMANEVPAADRPKVLARILPTIIDMVWISMGKYIPRRVVFIDTPIPLIMQGLGIVDNVRQKSLEELRQQYLAVIHTIHSMQAVVSPDVCQVHVVGQAGVDMPTLFGQIFAAVPKP